MDLNEVQLDGFLFDIQAFADGGEDGSEDTGAESTATDTDTTDEPTNEETEPFKVFKTQSELDSFLDKKIQKAIQTHDEKAKREAKRKRDYNSMTDLEKAEYDKKQLQAQLDEANRKATIVENRSNILQKFGEDDMPAGLISVLGNDLLSNTEELDKAYDNLHDVFFASVQKAVDKRLGDTSSNYHESSKTKASVGKTVADKFNQQNSRKTSDFWSTK